MQADPLQHLATHCFGKPSKEFPLLAGKNHDGCDEDQP